MQGEMVASPVAYPGGRLSPMLQGHPVGIEPRAVSEIEAALIAHEAQVMEQRRQEKEQIRSYVASMSAQQQAMLRNQMERSALTAQMQRGMV